MISLKNILLRFYGHIRWIRLGLRYKFILKVPYKDQKFTKDFFGYKYDGNLMDYIDRYVYYFGAYEREELDFIKKYIDTNSVILDIGANTGHHSLFFSSIAKEVYSFEPYKKMYDILVDRIEKNNIKNIHPYNFGLGSINKISDFFAPIGINSGVGSFIKGENTHFFGKLEIKNGDDFLKEINIQNIDFIKIDVEGMEKDVILGIMDIIKNQKPIMFIEANVSGQKFINERLSDIFMDYTVKIIDANNPIMLFFNIPGSKKIDFKISSKTENLILVPSHE